MKRLSFQNIERASIIQKEKDKREKNGQCMKKKFIDQETQMDKR